MWIIKKYISIVLFCATPVVQNKLQIQCGQDERHLSDASQSHKILELGEIGEHVCVSLIFLHGHQSAARMVQGTPENHTAGWCQVWHQTTALPGGSFLLLGFQKQIKPL